MRDALGSELLPPLEQLYAASPLLVALFDQHDTLRYANPAFRQRYNLASDSHPSWLQLMRDNYATGHGTRVETHDFDAWLASAASRRGKLPFRQFEVDMTDGSWILITETVDNNGWMLCVGVRIDELGQNGRHLRSARDKAVRSAHTDELTGISNRRHIMAQLETIPRNGDSGCVAMVDIDHFKQINDHYGHPFGDRVLRHCARHFQARLWRADSVGRIGGEEFLLLLPDTPPQAAAEKLTDILFALNTQPPFTDTPGFVYSCSIGITGLRHGDTAASLYQRADTALYHAKRAGRNRVAMNL